MTKSEKKHHISSWESSGQSKKAYCMAAGIKYATFLYWIRNDKGGSINLSKGKFIALTSPSISEATELLLPNGIRILQACPSDIDLIRLLYVI